MRSPNLPPDVRFHHAGIATEDAGPLIDLYGNCFDAPVVHEETVDDLAVTFLDLGNGYVEFLEPLPDADGAIASYLDREGGGIHHLALATDDLAGALADARAAGVTLVDEEPRAGAWGHEVAFLHPSDTGGVLIEFVGE